MYHRVTLTTIGLRANVIHFRVFGFVMVDVNFVFQQKYKDENKDRCHNDASDDNNHGSTKKLCMEGLTLLVCLLCGELHTPYHEGGCQRSDTIIINSKDTQVIVPPSNQVGQEERLARRWDHPAREDKLSLYIKKTTQCHPSPLS